MMYDGIFEDADAIRMICIIILRLVINFDSIIKVTCLQKWIPAFAGMTSFG